MDVLLAQPRSFCAGVVRAIEIVERALERYGAPVFVFHEIVHNRHVVEDLRARGVVFVDDLADIPWGATTVFSAHGVADAVVEAAGARNLRVIDATCPLVAKVHAQARQYAARGCAIVLIGHPGHEEVEGTMGSVDAPVYLVANVADVEALPLRRSARVAYVTQTTLSLDDTREIIAALEARFPSLQGPALDDICYATQNRQNGVRALAAQVDLVLVIGAPNSSNSNRLREVTSQLGVTAHLIEDENQIDPAWLSPRRRIGVTAGASAPESLVARVCARLRMLGATTVREMPGIRENVVFRLPASLRDGSGARLTEDPPSQRPIAATVTGAVSR
jgi:4-hydroxy-3-methylbut-2-enyl diphosphate reductase